MDSRSLIGGSSTASDPVGVQPAPCAALTGSIQSKVPWRRRSLLSVKVVVRLHLLAAVKRQRDGENVVLAPVSAPADNQSNEALISTGADSPSIADEMNVAVDGSAARNDPGETPCDFALTAPDMPSKSLLDLVTSPPPPPPPMWGFLLQALMKDSYRYAGIIMIGILTIVSGILNHDGGWQSNGFSLLITASVGVYVSAVRARNEVMLSGHCMVLQAGYDIEAGTFNRFCKVTTSAGHALAGGRGHCDHVVLEIEPGPDGVTSTPIIEGENETPMEAHLKQFSLCYRWLVSGVIVFALVVILLRALMRGQCNVPLHYWKLHTVLVILNMCANIMEILKFDGVTLALSLFLTTTMHDMQLAGGFANSLSAAESLGFSNTICSDEMEAVTESKVNMKVRLAWLAGSLWTPSQDLRVVLSSPVCTTLRHAFLLSRAPLDSTGKALVSWVQASISTVMPSEEACSSSAGAGGDGMEPVADILKEEPFDSASMRAGVLIKLTSKDGDERLVCHWAGKAETILNACSHHLADGATHVSPINDQVKKMLHDKIDQMAATPLRCVALAYKDKIDQMAATPLRCVALACKDDIEEAAPESPSHQSATAADWRIPDSGLTFIGLVGLENPRWSADVKKAVHTLVSVKVCMVTGDHVSTAKAMAKNYGISTDADSDVLDAAVFRALSENGRIERAPTISVLARASSSDKQMLVEARRKAGEEVSVIGDARTPYTSTMSDVFVTDIKVEQGLSCVAKLVTYARRIYANLQSFLQFHLATSVVLTVMAIEGLLLGRAAPFSATQLLWLSLITNTLAPCVLAARSQATQTTRGKPRAPEYHRARPLPAGRDPRCPLLQNHHRRQRLRRGGGGHQHHHRLHLLRFLPDDLQPIVCSLSQLDHINLPRAPGREAPRLYPSNHPHSTASPHRRNPRTGPYFRHCETRLEGVAPLAGACRPQLALSFGTTACPCAGTTLGEVEHPRVHQAGALIPSQHPSRSSGDDHRGMRPVALRKC